MSLAAVLAVASFAPPPVNMRLLPTRSRAGLLPGERRDMQIADERMRNFFSDGSGIVGQLLLPETVGGESLHVVPILRVNALGEDRVALTCIGRGQLELPLQPDSTFSRAEVHPIRDSRLECWSETVPAVRALHVSCAQLADRARRGPAMSRAMESVVGVFDAPLEETMRERRDNLYLSHLAAAKGDHAKDADADAAARRACAHGIAAPWLDEPLMRDLWCQTAGEMQIQLLSFTLAGRHLSPRGRLWALSCRDAYARLEVAAEALRRDERRLAAELSLQSWGAASSTCFPRRSRPTQLSLTAAAAASSSAAAGPPTAWRPDCGVVAALRALAAAAKDDVRGIATPDAAVPCLPECAHYIGAAFRRWLGSEDGAIVVGRDPRLSSAAIGAAACAGARGVDVGLSTTPAMLEALLVPDSEACGALMVTASHLPPEWNGLKLFSRALGRGLNQREVAEVMAAAVELAAAAEWNGRLDEAADPSAAAAVEVVGGFLEPYVDKLRAAVRLAARDEGELPLRGMRVCVNPGNGGGGWFATHVLAPLGADISPSINLAADGAFPAHMPNPEDGAHVVATVRAVGESGADVGVMLDTDVDRCGLIDGCTSPPQPVHKNRLIALCALDALEANGGRGGVIVTDPVTSTGVGRFIVERGGLHDRYQMGYRNVIDRAAATLPEPALLAIETSGHSAWRDNRFVDDGCYTAARLLGRLARERRERGGGGGGGGGAAVGLLELLSGSLEEPIESIKVKMGVMPGLSGVPDAERALCAALRRTAEATAGWEIEPVNHDGLRCSTPDGGWLIIRGSLHEPSVSVQTESDVRGGTAAICATLLEFVLRCGDHIDLIDLQPLRDEAARGTPY